jgi:hypothetical protein
MPDVVKAKCPHCQNVLRLQAAWVGQSLRCKHCQKVILLKPRKAGPTPPAAAVKPAPPLKQSAVKKIKSPAHVESNNSPFDFEDSADEPTLARRPPRRRQEKPSGTWWKGAVLGGCVFVLVVVLGVFFGRTLLDPGEGKSASREKKIAEVPKDGAGEKGDTNTTPQQDEEPIPENPAAVPPPNPKNETPKVEVPPPIKKTPPVPVNRDPFPRRALLIGVANYLYANQVQYGKPATDRFPGSSTGALAKHFANILHVPLNQVAELSDRGSPPRPPLKPAIEATVSDFLKECRGQDRIVLLFAGHAVEIDKEAYLVPQEADPDEADKLISFRWLYERLQGCKARQKLLILDVCRLDPVRGRVRAGGEPMGGVLNERILQAPEGVQVWSSCSPKQQSYEVDGGSAFLEGIGAALKGGLTIQSPGNPLPLDVLLPRVNAHLVARLRGPKVEQVSRITGKEAAGGDPYDPAAAPPPPVRILSGPVGKGDLARRALAEGILREINSVPTSNAARGRSPDTFPADALLVLPAKALEGYEADYANLDELKRNAAASKDKYALRFAVLDAVKEMNDSVQKFVPREKFQGAVNDQVKKQIHAEQRGPGQAIAGLERALAALEKAGKGRDKESSKRWQANYDFTLARLKSRLVYLYEYNNLLAQIRGDALPPLTDGATAYHVTPRKKVQVPEGVVKTWVKEIATTWSKILRDYPNTPWALMARREQSAVLGLEWRPYRP